MNSNKAIALILVLGLLAIVAANCGGNGSSAIPTAVPDDDIEVALTGSISFANGVPAQRFQNVFLNITNVLINPKANAIPSNKKWRPVGVPSPLPTGSPAGAFQLDLNNVTTAPVVYNTTIVQDGNYKTLQLQFDTGAPGSIVPICTGGPTEGCASYPIQFQSSPPPLILPLNPPLVVNSTAHANIMINLALTVVGTPSVTGGAYTVTVTPTLVSPTPLEAIVSGTTNASASPSTKGKKGNHLSATAEIAGTNTVVADLTVTKGQFVLGLPAAADIGTLYDVVISGGAVAFGGLRLPVVFPNQTFTPTIDVASGLTTGAITGTISDSCTGTGIPGATVQILIPPTNSSGVVCTATPDQCISVLTATADSAGNNPLPSQIKHGVIPFQNLPIPTKGIETPYTLEISATGYDTLFKTGIPTGLVSGVGGNCGTKGSAEPCNFSLTSGQITGQVSLTGVPPPGQPVSVEVFAEDSGTNNLVAMLPQPIVITNPSSTGPFTLHVPSGPATLDLYAEADDTFNGAATPFTGHTIIVQQGVTGFDGTPNCTPVSPVNLFSQNMDCVGHGSIAGTFVSPTSGTSAVLSKDGVQLFSSSVGLTLDLGGNTGPTYSFCAPPDTYDVQAFAVTNPAPSVTPMVTPTPLPIGTPTPVTVPAPAPTTTGCPTTCSSNSTGTSCPGNCVGTIPAPLQGP
jgi:hypothetical protein